MKAYFTKRAERAAERIDARWRANADDTQLFARELLAAIELLESSESSGVTHPSSIHPNARRLLLRKSRCHLYFEVDDAHQRIYILHLWDGRRERPPKI